MSVYFTSDLHFGHELVLKKYPNFRKGANVAEMDENLITAWNALVTPYIKAAMDKKFKEACRRLAVPPINRGFLFAEGVDLALFEELL